MFLKWSCILFFSWVIYRLYGRNRLYRTRDITSPCYFDSFRFDSICLNKRSDVTNPHYIEPIYVFLKCSIQPGSIVNGNVYCLYHIELML